MKFQSYEWFNNLRGLHNNGPFRPFHQDRYTEPRMGWASLVAGGNEYVKEAAGLVEHQCMPIIRIDRTEMGAMIVPDPWYDTYQEYYDVGCRWFELYNEPNNPENWPKNALGEPYVEVNWENTSACIAPLMNNWLDWAERIIEMGAYPAFPALQDATEKLFATARWYDACLRYLSKTHYARFMQVVGNGLWCATHPQVANRFYQEPPGGPPWAARPSYQYDYTGSGWHFEYPYDPVTQQRDPGRTVFGSKTFAPYGDTRGLIGAGQAFQDLLKHHLDAGPVPIIAAQGGIAPVISQASPPVQQDPAYPPYTYEVHAEAVLAMYKWLAETGPFWLLGVVLTDEAAYFEDHGPSLTIRRLIDTAPEKRKLPDVDTGGIYVDEPFPDLVEPVTLGFGEKPASAKQQKPNAKQSPGGDEPRAGEGMTSKNANNDQPVSDEGVPEWLEEITSGEDISKDREDSWLEELIDDEIDLEISSSEAVEDVFAAPELAADRASLQDELADLIMDVPDSDVLSADTAIEPDDAGVDMPGSEAEDIPEGVPAWLDMDDNPEPPSQVRAEYVDRPAEKASSPPPVDMPYREISPEREKEIPVSAETRRKPGPSHKEAPVPNASAPSDLPPWLSPEDLLAMAPEIDGKVSQQTVPEAKPKAGADDVLGEAVELRDERAVPAPDITVSSRQKAARAGYTGKLDYHWLHITRDVDPVIFFEENAGFWQKYQPVLVRDFKMLPYIPADKRIAITILTLARNADVIETQLLSVRPDVILDIIVVDDRAALRAEMEWRVSTGKVLG